MVEKCICTCTNVSVYTYIYIYIYISNYLLLNIYLYCSQDLGEIGCPPLKELVKVGTCSNHYFMSQPVCAAINVVAMKKWIMRQQQQRQRRRRRHSSSSSNDGQDEVDGAPLTLSQEKYKQHVLHTMYN